jgi:hypothetical protein
MIIQRVHISPLMTMNAVSFLALSGAVVGDKGIPRCWHVRTLYLLAKEKNS